MPIVSLPRTTGTPRDPHRLRQVDDLADTHIGIDGDRVAYDAAFEFLDAQYFPRLFLRQHVLVNDADTAFLGQRYCQPGLRHGVHRRGHDRDVEADFPGELGRQVHFAGQHVRVVRLEENVVERECFPGYPHT